MKEICKNCANAGPTYKGIVCGLKKKKVKTQDSCENLEVEEMTYRECIEALDAYMHASFAVNAKAQKKAEEALEELKAMDWVPVMGGDGQMPEVDEDGYSDPLLLSFYNFSSLTIGEYRVNEDGGAFYNGDDDRTLASYNLIVSAWRPLPDRYREE